mgnify:CR=1 FL=1
MYKQDQLLAARTMKVGGRRLTTGNEEGGGAEKRKPHGWLFERFSWQRNKRKKDSAVGFLLFMRGEKTNIFCSAVGQVLNANSSWLGSLDFAYVHLSWLGSTNPKLQNYTMAARCLLPTTLKTVRTKSHPIRITRRVSKRWWRSRHRILVMNETCMACPVCTVPCIMQLV